MPNDEMLIQAARETAAHIDSLLASVGERGEVVLYPADINALWARSCQLRAALDRAGSPQGDD